MTDPGAGAHPEAGADGPAGTEGGLAGAEGGAPDPPTTALAVTVTWIRCAAATIHERRSWLTDLDAAIGDGDHGINLDRGFGAVLADLERGALPAGDASTLLTATGRRLLGLVGGASGALYGRGLMTAGERLRDADPSARTDGRALAALALAGATDAIVALGHAAVGEKTMLDALRPALEALRQAPPGLDLPAVMRLVAEAAEAGAASTIPLVARKGRASYLGERSAGHLDPGAASCAILVRCLADAVAIAAGGTPPDPPAPF